MGTTVVDYSRFVPGTKWLDKDGDTHEILAVREAESEGPIISIWGVNKRLGRFYNDDGLFVREIKPTEKRWLVMFAAGAPLQYDNEAEARAAFSQGVGIAVLPVEFEAQR